jgi:hypothetical protein
MEELSQNVPCTTDAYVMVPTVLGRTFFLSFLIPGFAFVAEPTSFLRLLVVLLGPDVPGATA